MAEILLASTTGFSETATEITIQKSALAYTGYSPRTAMNLEEFVLALTNKMGTIFTQAAQDADADRQILITVPDTLDYNITGTVPNRFATWDYTLQFRQPAPAVTFTPLNF